MVSKFPTWQKLDSQFLAVRNRQDILKFKAIGGYAMKYSFVENEKKHIFHEYGKYAVELLLLQLNLPCTETVQGKKVFINSMKNAINENRFNGTCSRRLFADKTKQQIKLIKRYLINY